MITQSENDPVYARLCEVIRQVTRLTGPWTPEAHLIDDLCLDSLKFVDLTVEIETAFGIAEFPMQAWLDDRWERGEAITLSALADACRAHSPQGTYGTAATED